MHKYILFFLEIFEFATANGLLMLMNGSSFFFVRAPNVN